MAVSFFLRAGLLEDQPHDFYTQEIRKKHTSLLGIEYYNIFWVVPPPCNSRKGFTFWFNRGLLLTSFWDCYRVGAVPKIYL